MYAGGRGELDDFGGGERGEPYVLTYDGCMCTAVGALVSHVSFQSHMYLGVL